MDNKVSIRLRSFHHDSEHDEISERGKSIIMTNRFNPRDNGIVREAA